MEFITKKIQKTINIEITVFPISFILFIRLNFFIILMTIVNNIKTNEVIANIEIKLIMSYAELTLNP